MNKDSSIDQDRFQGLMTSEESVSGINPTRSKIIRILRYGLPVIAIVMIVIIGTWDDAGRSAKPLNKADVLPQSENIQNELLKPVFNSVDDKNQPYTVTADRAVQSKSNPDIMELENPVASLTQNDSTKLDGRAKQGLYEQKAQKLNLKGDVVLSHSNGYSLSSQELRIDIAAQKAYSGQDVMVSGVGGTLESKGLEGDFEAGILTFTGPARVVIHQDGNLFKPKEKGQME